MRTLLFLALFPLLPVTAQRVAIAADKMNICYIGVENPMSAAAFGCTEKNLVLRTSNGYFVNSGGGKFIYHPAEPGNTLISAYCLKGRDSVLLGQTWFRIKELPSPRAAVARKYGGPISKTQLLAQMGIEAFLENFDFNAPFTVTAYEFSIRRSNGSVTSALTGSSAYFTPEVKAAMETLADGDQVIFDNIRCKGPDGKTRNIGSLVFVIN